jgi:cell fate regulator YaaT (PSP1 superfamily)
MPDVVGVVFQPGGKVYYFDPVSLELARGAQVVVQTMRGTEIGEVVDPPHAMEEHTLPAALKRVVRLANEKDLELVVANRELRREAMATCRRLIAEHGLDMKLVDAEMVFGGGKITFSFVSEERVDFRSLVSDLARALKMRIELRQIGAREEARLIGGLGPCGRHLCCSLFPVSQEPVSIRMAKEQSLPLNPMKISGLCGRLMCCLKYEQDQYVGFRKEAPRCGSTVETTRGPGVVIGYQVPKDSLTVRFEDGSIEDIPLDTCSCGGTPCRHRADSAPVQGDDAVACAPAEPAGGACEPATYAEAPPDLAASAVALSEADPVGERAEGQSDQVQTAEGDEATPKRSRPRRRRRRPRSSGEGGNGTSE